MRKKLRKEENTLKKLREHEHMGFVLSYTHHEELKDKLDLLLGILGILSPLLLIPQIIKIWMEKDATGFYVYTWFGFLLVTLVWLSYGLIHKKRAVILTSSMWICAIVFVIGGSMLHS